MFARKILLLSPHMDDEVLGCGGLIAHIMEIDPMRLHIHYFNDFHPLFDYDTYNQENDELISRIGCTKSVSLLKNVNRLDAVPIKEHILEIEQLVNKHRPDTALVAFPSYNQDHRRVFEASVTATRPHDRNFYVRNILVYEQPETLQTNRIEPRFIPHVFLPIDIERKCELYGIYKTQAREHRSSEHVRHLAAIRGMQCNVPFAESFMIIRVTTQAIDF